MWHLSFVILKFSATNTIAFAELLSYPMWLYKDNIKWSICSPAWYPAPVDDGAPTSNAPKPFWLLDMVWHHHLMVLYHTAKLPVSLSPQNVVMFETITQSNFISKYPSFTKYIFLKGLYIPYGWMGLVVEVVQPTQWRKTLEKEETSEEGSFSAWMCSGCPM